MARATPTPQSRARVDRIASEQLNALFGSVLVGVAGAALAAWALIYLLVDRDIFGAAVGFGWASYITFCACLHAALGAARWWVNPKPNEGRRWARLFTLVSLFEGLGWGALPIMAGVSNDFTYELSTLTVSLIIVTGSITAFSPYFPSFAAFLLPSTIPYFFWAATRSDTNHFATATLMLIYLVAIFQVARVASRRFRSMLQLQIEIEEQVTLAALANDRLSTFLAMASHELRTPAQDLSNRAATLAANPNLSPAVRGDAEDIYQRSQLINEMFGAMLNLSLLDAGKKTPNKRQLQLGPILRAIADENRSDAQKKGLSLRLVGTTASIISDGPMLSVIISNLVRNAIRYTSHGHILLGARVKRAAGTVSIQVLDTGPGIEPEDQQHVFGAFYQVDTPKTHAAQGVGLGLAIVQRFAALLDATISLRSIVGRGSQFAVTVPLSTTPVQEEADDDMPLQTSRLIALVDDNEEILESTTALLRSWGHRVVWASSGEGIVFALSTENSAPDLIIADYQLHDNENGIDVIERLRSEYNEDIPALLVTGDGTPGTLERARGRGVPLLQSPVAAKSLRAAVTGLTAKSGMSAG
jgi:signal transduction histidine kinase/CheY-like chemotaxis protein